MAAQPTILVPYLNPLRFYSEGNSLQNIAVPFETDVYQNVQKFVKGMFLNFQIHCITGSVLGYTSVVEDLEGNEIMEWIATERRIVGSDYEYTILAPRGLTNSAYDIIEEVAAGCYRLKFVILFVDTEKEDVTLYSEWFEICDTVENQLLIRYSHPENDYDVAFMFDVDGSYPQTFEALIEGGMWSNDFTPATSEEVYQDQIHDLVTLKSIPFNTIKLTFGTAKGIPNWRADWLNRVFSLDTVTVNNIQYRKAEGAKLESESISRYPYRTWKLEVIKPETTFSNSYGDATVLGDFNDDFNNDFF